MLATLDSIVSAIRPPIVGVAVRYPVRVRLDAWVLPEGTVPESIFHDVAAQHFKLLLEVWAARSPVARTIARNLAIRWLQNTPQIGIDPDVCILEPPPPDVNQLGSLCLWKPGHAPPTLCLEVVSANHPHKDYAELQDRYASVNTRELVVFDPLLAGPRVLGGPVLLQLWRRDEFGMLERVYAGDQPVLSQVLGAWLVPTSSTLEIASDRDGVERWQSWEAQALAERAEKERERAEKERERAEKEAERAEKEAERAARLEAERQLAELKRTQNGS